MATYTKQLKDENGNTIYPDVGIPLDDVLFGDTVEEVTPEPWVDTTEIVDEAVTDKKIAFSSVAKIIEWESRSATVSSTWQTVTIFPQKTVSNLSANATYIIILSCGTYSRPGNLENGDKMLRIGTPTSGASITFNQDYTSNVPFYNPKIIGFLDTGNNTSVSIYGYINTGGTGTFRIEGGKGYLIRVA